MQVQCLRSIFDGDINTVVIFKNQDLNASAVPSIKVQDNVATLRDRLFMYFHPFNHEAKHRRLRAFDVECYRDSTWFKVG